MLPLLAPLAVAAPPLLVEAFDAQAVPAAWSVSNGAQVGTGPESRVAVEDGALVLRVDANTQQFRALTRTLPLDGAAAIKVSARMRTENVDPAAAKYDNCFVFVQFPNSKVRPLAPLAGTTPWAAQEGVFTVPAGVSEVTVGLFLSMPGTAWFDDVRVEAVAQP